ncbi:MFS transporter [uncultured Winogradskyella sp.]|uniref:MFS transporter n=1 Tax=uncultured Winogradskyella sp. TaxID=395353 RepID=UPI0030EBE8E2|tara:strand:+ start:1817 stop:2230 length:414 start_codon:yes stop_codon:yes gene_type:complete
MAEKLKIVKIIHLAICAGVIFAYILLSDLSVLADLKFPVIDASSYIYLMIPVIAILASNYLYKSQIKKVDSNLKLEDKIPFYQIATIMRLALLEGAAFLILFVKPDFIVFGILIILYIIFIRPTENQFRRDFENPRL